jgi:hypothetical protein
VDRVSNLIAKNITDMLSRYRDAGNQNQKNRPGCSFGATNKGC